MLKRVLRDNVLEIYENDELVLMISETITDGEMVMRLFGSIKSTVAHELEDELMAAVSFSKAINIDMANVRYISGNALQSLLTVQRVVDETDVSLVVVAMSDVVREVFEDCGFSEILHIK